MPSLQWRLDKLTDAPAAARSDLLLQALSQCEPAETELIARAALTSGTSVAVAAVIRLLDKHPTLHDELLALDRQVFIAGLQIVFSRSSPKVAELAIKLIQRRNDPQVSLELLVPLKSAEASVQTAAAKTILDITILQAGPTGRRISARGMSDALDTLICGGLESYEIHRRQEVVLAAAIVHGRLETKLRAMLASPGTPQRLAVQGIPRHTNNPLVRRNLIRWLNSALLGRQSAQFLDTLREPGTLSDALSGAHLLIAPSRRKMLAHADRAARSLPDVCDAVSMTEGAQRRLPGYVSALPMPASRQVAYLSDLIALPSPAARWRAVEIIMAHRATAAQDATRYFARDRHPSVAISPAAHLLHDEYLLSISDLRSLCQSGHPTMSRRAMTALASRNAEQWAEIALELPRSALIATAIRLRDSQRAALFSQLKIMLASPQRERCLCGIFVARRLRVTEELDGPLSALLQSEDAQRCSAAISALADYVTPRRTELLEHLLQHEHGRVRANAVEALAKIAQESKSSHGAATIVEVIAPRSVSRHNRERANALAAWIRHGDRQGRGAAGAESTRIDVNDAVDGLNDMLRDPDPLHRVSALWAASRTQRQEFAGELRIMARNETLEPVRRRAVIALRRLTVAPTGAS